MKTDVLAIFPNDFPAANKWEGSRTRVSGQILGLARARLRVALACVEDRTLPSNCRSAYNGVPLVNISHPVAFNLHYALFPLLATIRLPHVIKILKPRIAHFHLAASGFSLLSFLRHDVIKIFDLHDMFFLREEFFKRSKNIPSLIGDLCDAIEGSLFEKFDAVFVTTPLMLKAATRFSDRPAYVIPNGVDTSFFSAGERKTGSHFTIGYLGSTKEFLGFYQFVRAIALVRTRIPDILGLVVGTHDAKARDFVRQNKLQQVIQLKGHVPYRELPDLMRSMDLAVTLRQRNVCRLELADFYQATKLIEFMSCGIPVVATPLMEQSRLITESGCGLVASGYSGELIAEAIIEMHNHRSQMQTMGINGRAYVIKYHAWPQVIAKMLEAYRELENQ